MKRQFPLLLLVFAFFAYASIAQKKSLPNQPKLVVGIVVDQMSYDFLVRYQDKFTEGGFRRMLNGGFNCRNTHYNYVPTYTAPGHTCVYTGSVPAIHGIIANEWFDRRSGATVYCTEDSTVKTLGSESAAGLMSPRNMLVTTVTDQLRLASNNRSKVVGIALKDRGAILPAGHMANAAYWFDSFNGHWISSSYYMNDLPAWVKDFNNRQLPNQYLSQVWTPLLAADQYTHSTADAHPAEGTFAGETSPVFPHDLPKLRKSDFELLRSTPFGNTLTKEFALAALQNENLGKGPATDFLAVSFSSTDYVGHQFGPYSVETEDTYLRLDRELADFIQVLDKQLGMQNVLIFLTADHGVAPAPLFAQSVRIPGGVFDARQAIENLKRHLETVFGTGNWIVNYSNQQLFLNQVLIREKKNDAQKLFREIETYMLTQQGVSNVVDLHNLPAAMLPEYELTFIRNGQNRQRSGDIMLVLQPGWIEGRGKGTTHSTFYNYDTHVPLLWYGWKIPKGETSKRYAVADIAPTVANLLNLLEPSGCTGVPITEIK